ncbi:MAG: PAS domain S-box protein [Bryobacteraceae bacterium]
MFVRGGRLPFLAQLSAHDIQQALQPYLIGVICVLAAALLRFTFASLLQYEGPTGLFIIAVTITACRGGTVPGVFATALSIVVVEALFMGRPHSWYPEEAEQVHLSLFAVLGFIISSLSGRLLEAKRLVEESEATNRALLESASQGIVSVDPAGSIVTFNSTAERMFGYSREEVVGRELEVLIPEEARRRHVAHRNAYFRQPSQRRMILGHNIAGRRKDGTEFPAEISLSFVETRQRRLAVSFITDVTERKASEEALRQAQKLESLGMLAGGIAHDFNNLLVGVMANASLVQESLPKTDPDRELLDRVVEAGERAAELTRQLLAYAGKGRFFIEPIHLSHLIREIRGLISSSIPKRVNLRLDLEDDLPLVSGDTGQIRQIVMNLAINGAEAIGEQNAGEVAVTTSAQQLDEGFIQPNFAKTGIQAGCYVLLEVRDTGSGMDEGTLERIFDPFFTTKFTGRGLGLSAVQGIVRGHGGAIAVKSIPGQGTVFRVWLPTGASPAEQITPPSPESLRGTETILVVDDEQLVLHTARESLEHYGYRVLLAEDGREGVKVFASRRQDISVVLLDLAMPEMNGEQALRHMRNMDPEAPIILTSGYSEAEARRRFAGQAVSGFLQKPYKASALAATIRQVLRR